MFKKSKVVMLPINNEANEDSLIFIENRLMFQTKNEAKNDRKWSVRERFHLYFLSDEEIKKGDWYVKNGVSVHQSAENGDYKNCKKIIATTDKSLSSLLEPHRDQYGDMRHNKFQELPAPSKSFIEKFINDCNKYNVITEVLVEYENKSHFYITGFDAGGETLGYNNNEVKLKVSKDNTITIKKVKDSWSREEVVNLISKHFVEAGSKIGLGQDVTEFTNKWIEENL